jgi:hypothetical protein
MDLKSYAKKKRNHLLTSAKKRKIEICLSATELLSLLENSGPACPLCYNLYTDGNDQFSPYNRSVDRLDCRVGYFLENIRIICKQCNEFRSTQEEFFNKAQGRTRISILD